MRASRHVRGAYVSQHRRGKKTVSSPCAQIVLGRGFVGKEGVIFFREVKGKKKKKGTLNKSSL